MDIRAVQDYLTKAMGEERRRMEFDKSRVYTALNADELKVGSKVIVGDTLQRLKENIEDNKCHILEKIGDESMPSRFFTNSGSWYFAYLIEPPEEKVLKWTDLKIGDILKEKKENKRRMVVGIDEDSSNVHVLIGGMWLTDEGLKYWEKVEEEK